MSAANGIWTFGENEGLPSIAGYATSSIIIDFDKKRRRTLNMAVIPPKKEGSAFKPRDKVRFFGNCIGYVTIVQGKKVWIDDGTTPFWVHETQLEKVPPRKPEQLATQPKRRH